MVRKKKEGNEVQRRAAALRARRAGETPSEEHTTTGASKQRTHVPRRSHSHEERTAHIHEGKQGSVSRPAAGGGGRGGAVEPWPTFRGRGHPGYTEEHEQVYQALADAQAANGGAAVMLGEVARAAARPLEETRVLMHDLTAVQGLATELQHPDDPDLGSRYETRPGF
ncbi:hypothetical protein GCM10012287_03320 [Streptomyces daqingensis]|uniref:Uncharacterized protein n=1 Tax=Streptomyces daqingensis TaxID=1472640 RepID=A0ABQ2LRV2_9ACTN|nr:hypothetical protein [Streptomyces daqingensis]GGO42429.1 hypothetical protein GCM10012287_03320 [Streptomyces daqingensis]